MVQVAHGKGANNHCMDILDPPHTGSHVATFRRIVSQAGCMIQLTNDRSNDSNKGVLWTPGNHNMNPKSQGPCMTEQIILCSRSTV